MTLIVTPARHHAVVVVGAGMTGLVIAERLSAYGLRPLVLEARRRVGGRVWTYRFPDPHMHAYGELGALRIPLAHHRTLRLIDRIGLGCSLDTMPRLADAPATVSDLDGSICPVGRTLAAPLREPGDVVARVAWLLRMLAPRSLSQQFDTIAAGRLRCSLQARAVQQETPNYPQHPEDLLTYLTKRHRNALGGQLCAAFIELALEIGPRQTIRGGMYHLPRRLSQRSGATVLLGHKVTALADDDGTARLICTTPHGSQVGLTARYVVFTAPPPTLAGVRVSGGAASLAQRLAELPLSGARKTLFHLSRRIWDQGAAGGTSGSDQVIRQIFYPLADDTANRGCTCTVLTASYATAEDTEAFSALSPAQRRRAIIAAVGRIHPEVHKQGVLLATRTVDWLDQPFSRGAFTGEWAGYSENHGGYLDAGRLIFAGDTFSSKPGWIEGAVDSADAVTRRLLGRLTGGTR